MQMRARKSHYYGSAVPAVMAAMLWSTQACAQQRSFDIPAQEAPRAIPEFARQAGIEILAPTERLRGLRLPAVQGTYDVHEALSILLAGSGLTVASDDGKFITLREEAASKSKTIGEDKAPRTPPMPPQQQIAALPASVAASAVEEIIVTGSRIVREGYEAPTPLTVVSVEELQKSADSNLLNIMNTMPALSGSATATTTISGLSPGNAGVQSLNLRSLGSTRVLVLLDGQRTVGAQRDGSVDVASFPSQLIQRVDVVTGGASAVYGSDAIAGVVNFVLNKKFTGVKGEVSGGITNYGDDKNYKVELSAGFGFGPDDRGHVLVSGQHSFNGGIQGSGGRAWDEIGIIQMSNPNYTATNGQPQQLIRQNAASGAFTLGGIITGGPLKGTYFGPGGAPGKYNYGVLYSNPYLVEGDWKLSDLRPFADIDPVQTYDSVFTRAAYDVADNINVFIQWGWSQAKLHDVIAPWWVLGGAANAPIIKIDNAFLPASIRAAMVANGITSFPLGTANIDMEPLDVYSVRFTNRFSGGFEGRFEALDTLWRWNAAVNHGASKIRTGAPMAPLRVEYLAASDAVVNPATGQIVCRIALTNPNTACRPWNVMGIGVNQGNEAAEKYINNGGLGGYAHGLIQQTTYAASVTGEPFAVWAGPVSIALSIEHRKDKIDIKSDIPSTTGAHILGNEPALFGKQSVTEGAVETLIPLAKGESWARAWDLSLGARFTGYELSGFVSTWKVGTTYAPIDDIKFRFTRSRDIRAPNLQELFTPVNIMSGSGQLVDRTLPGSPSYAVNRQNSTGNPSLKPERADTTGIGVVLSPTLLSGFTASADFWDVNIDGAINQLTTQQVIDLCTGRMPSLCANLTRDPATGLITEIKTFGINLATQDVRGIDLEASYRASLSDVVTTWPGAVSLHGLMTFYLRNYQDNTFQLPTNKVGENATNTPPNWKLTVTASYALDPVTVSLTGRAVSAGVINATYIQCTSGCPTSTADHTTIDNNHLGGRAYLDANVSYKFLAGESSTAEMFFSVKNIFDNSFPAVPTSFLTSISATSPLYDPLGTVFRTGIRFKM